MTLNTGYTNDRKPKSHEGDIDALRSPSGQWFSQVSTNGLTLLLGHHPGQVDCIVQELEAAQGICIQPTTWK